jgi:hypothetical protein
MKISLVMTAYKRGALLDNTLATVISQTRQPDEIIIVEDGHDNNVTYDVCLKWQQAGLPIHYYCRRDRPNMNFSNGAIPKNIGIQKSSGDILILQCAEVKYLAPDDVKNLVRPVEENHQISTFAHCLGIEHPNLMVEYCQAVWREHVIAIRGFEESFQGYAFEDCNFQHRLRGGCKVTPAWADDVTVEHQTHDRVMNPESVYWEDMKRNNELAGKWGAGDYLANEGRPWGVLKESV